MSTTPHGEPQLQSAFIGLGSNLARPEAQVTRALAELAQLAGCHHLRASSLYRSRPMGPQDQPDYVNAVVSVETSLQPLALLDAMQAIEQVHGRVRGPQRWGPRTLDLDLLLFGSLQLELPRLVIPHPGLPQRSFVVVPLLELAPDLVLPNGTRLASLEAGRASDGLERIA